MVLKFSLHAALVSLVWALSSLGALASPPGDGPDISFLPVLDSSSSAPAAVDYLVAKPARRAEVFRSEDGRELILTNGLVRRVWRVRPAVACVAFDELRSSRSILRAVRPEARLIIDGETATIGGLAGQVNHAYLTPEGLDALKLDPSAYRCVRISVGEPRPRFPWRRVRHHAPNAAWPPPGASLRFDFVPPEDNTALAGVVVSVHYELYDGVPVLSKWLRVSNGTEHAIDVDRFTLEILAVVEHDNPVELRAGVDPLPPDSLHVETDYAFGGFTHRNAARFSVSWRADPAYHTQVNWAKQTPCLLVVEPTRGPDQTVPPGEVFESFRAFELVHDSSERERRGLALRRMYRTIAPWVTENPLILHVVSTDPDIVRRAIDQAAECGFEMVSLSFGSGLNMEDGSDENLEKFRALSAYAAERGIHLGGYSLLSSRRVKPDGDNCIHPETGKPGGQTHGYCPALASAWGQSYLKKLRAFYERTGFLQFTHDGSYPGDFDAAARPPLQKGLDDSQWVQWREITSFYRWLRSRGVYLRVPDYYFLSGSNECGMGYREVNWSLPRDQQVIHTRQNIFDGTWEKTPSMGWMFVPLTQYHGGGAAATIEPLDQHIEHYERMLTSNLGLGVQAVYRGHRLYDTDRVRDLVTRWVAWYKEHRSILESDLVHGRRADGRDLDWMLHVGPDLETKGMLVVYNPLPKPRRRTISVPLYYTGIAEKARITSDLGDETDHALDRTHRVALDVEVPARAMRWFAIRSADE